MKEKSYREYLKLELARCEAKLPTLKHDPVRYSIAFKYVLDLRRVVRKGIPQDTDNSIYLQLDTETY